MTLKTINIMKKLIFLLLLVLPFVGFGQAAYLMEFTNPNGSKVVFNLNDVRSCVAEGTGSYLFTRTGSGKTQVQESPATIATNSCGNIVLFTVYLPANQFNTTKQMGVNPNYVVGVVSNTSGDGVLKMINPTENFTTTSTYDAAVALLSICVSGGGGGGSLTNTYVGFGDGLNQLDGEAGFTYDAESNRLAVDTVKTKRITAKVSPLEILGDITGLSYTSSRNDAGRPTSIASWGTNGEERRDGIYELVDSLRADGLLALADSNTIQGLVRANEGVSKSGDYVQLGNAVGGTAGRLTANRDLPMGGFALAMTGASTNGGLVLNQTAAQGFRASLTAFAVTGVKPGIGAYADNAAAIFAQSSGTGRAIDINHLGSTPAIEVVDNSVTASNSGIMVRQNTSTKYGFRVVRTSPADGLDAFYVNYEGSSTSVPFHGITGASVAYKFYKYGGTDGTRNSVGELRLGPNGFNTASANGTILYQPMSIQAGIGNTVDAGGIGTRLDDNTSGATKTSLVGYSTLSGAGTSTVHFEAIGHEQALASSIGQRLFRTQGNFQATGKLIDSAGSAGTTGQVLTSTSTATAWASNPFSALTVITAVSSDAANTAYGGAVGTLFWWKPTASAGKILMEKE